MLMFEIQPLCGCVGAMIPIPPVAPVAIHIQPLRGLKSVDNILFNGNPITKEVIGYKISY